MSGYIIETPGLAETLSVSSQFCELEQQSSQSLSNFKKDLVCGSFSGVASWLIGHPLDSIKVRMQMATNIQRNSLASYVKLILKNEGFSGFYKGGSPPLMTLPLVNSIVFSSYEFFK